MTRCLITGVNGFLGSYLAESLLDRGELVAGTVNSDRRNVEHLGESLAVWSCDIQDRTLVEAVVEATQPQVVFHLAAQSLPVLSWKEPETTFKVNTLGTLHLLEAIRKASIDPIIVVACSSAEYGFNTPDEIPIKEEKPLLPASPYGVSKVATDLLAHLYWRAYGMKVIRVRPFFVIGPRKVGDACSDFARGIVAIERGEQGAISVGNLEAVRDFLDVQDAVQAFSLLAEKGAAGEVYNLCSGEGHPVREVLDTLISLATVPVPVVQDPARMRPSDEQVVVGNNDRLRALGWSPRIPLPETLANILQHWRERSDSPVLG